MPDANDICSVLPVPDGPSLSKKCHRILPKKVLIFTMKLWKLASFPLIEKSHHASNPEQHPAPATKRATEQLPLNLKNVT
jgi:hypothetical protein